VNYVEPVIQVDLIDLSDVMRDGKLTIAPGLVFSPEPYLQIKFEYDFVLEHAAVGGTSATRSRTTPLACRSWWSSRRRRRQLTK
jgi:hypothetical protein